MKLSRTSIAVLLVALVSATGGCTLVNRVRAKNALNEGARAYKDGRFPDAEARFREAYELDPTQRNAQIFIARAVQQQYKPGVQTPENLAIGEKAVTAYQDILEVDPDNEDAYKAVVFLYGQMKRDEQGQRAALAARQQRPDPEGEVRGADDPVEQAVAVLLRHHRAEGEQDDREPAGQDSSSTTRSRPTRPTSTRRSSARPRG